LGDYDSITEQPEIAELPPEFDDLPNSVKAGGKKKNRKNQ